MATKADFTEDEWETMQKGVTGAGLLVATSDRDFTDAFGEASALGKALSAQHDSAPSELVRELARTRSTGFGLTTSPRDLEDATLGSLRSAMDILQTKAPDERDQYRRLVLDVAEAVAGAKSGVEPQESAALQRIQDALGGD
jgi:hypothetical protein